MCMREPPLICCPFAHCSGGTEYIAVAFTMVNNTWTSGHAPIKVVRCRSYAGALDLSIASICDGIPNSCTRLTRTGGNQPEQQVRPGRKPHASHPYLQAIAYSRAAMSGIPRSMGRWTRRTSWQIAWEALLPTIFAVSHCRLARQPLRASSLPHGLLVPPVTYKFRNPTGWLSASIEPLLRVYFGMLLGASGLAGILVRWGCDPRCSNAPLEAESCPCS